jgi:hypothetical protein
MKKNKIIFGSLLFTIILIAVSCEKKVGKLPAENAPATTTTTTGGTVNMCDTITYTRHIKPIIDADCLHCHNNNFQQGLTNLSTYSLLKIKAEAGRIKARVIDGKPSYMPQDKGKLPAAKLDLISCWLSNGMKE